MTTSGLMTQPEIPAVLGMQQTNQVFFCVKPALSFLYVLVTISSKVDVATIYGLFPI